MGYYLGQVDPTPPPVRPINWLTIFGWTVVVGTTLAIFSGTINVRANRRRSSRRNGTLRALRWAESGRPKRKHAKKGKRRTPLEMLDARISLHGVEHGRRYSGPTLFAAWKKKYGRKSSLRRNPRYRMWSGPMYAKPLARAIREAGAYDVIAGTEHVIFRTDDLDALKARAGIARPFLDFRGVKMIHANGRWTVVFVAPDGGRHSMSYATKRAAEEAMSAARARGYTAHFGIPKRKRRTTRNGRSEHRRSSNREVSDLIQAARAQGWQVMASSGGHWIFRSPDKSIPQIIVAGTPGGGNRSLDNARAKLKRAGLAMNRRRRTSRRR